MASKSITCVWGLVHAAETLEATRGETIEVTLRVEDPPLVAGGENTPRNCTGSTLSIAWECARGRTGSPRRMELPGSANGVHVFRIPASDVWYFADAIYAWDAWITSPTGEAVPLVSRSEIIGRVGVGPGGAISTDLPVHRIYSGVGTAGITAPATIEAMAHQDITSRSFLAPVTASNQKIYIAHPAAWGTPIISCGSFALDTLDPISVPLHDADGELVVYSLHESRNLLTIAATVDVRFI